MNTPEPKKTMREWSVACFTQPQDKSEPPVRHASLRQAKLHLGYSTTADLFSRYAWDPDLKSVGTVVRGHALWLESPTEADLQTAKMRPARSLFVARKAGRPPTSEFWVCRADPTATEKDIRRVYGISALARFLGTSISWVSSKINSAKYAVNPFGRPCVEFNTLLNGRYWVGRASRGFPGPFTEVLNAPAPAAIPAEDGDSAGVPDVSPTPNEASETVDENDPALSCD